MKGIMFFLFFVALGNLSFGQNSYSKRRNLDVYSYSFDGVDSKITFPHSDSLSLERTDSFTIETWVKLPAASPQKYFYAKYDGALNRGINLYVSNGQLWFTMQNSPTNRITTLITDSAGYVLLFNSQVPINKWVQICITYDGSSNANGLKFYFSGRPYPVYLIYSNNLTGTIQNTQPVTIGYLSSIYSLYKQSVTRLFRKALTPSEITTLYNNGVVNYHPGISRCVLDMQVRNDPFSANFTVIDSALGNNGTTVGMTSGQRVRVDSMQGMVNMKVQTFSGNSINYETFGTTGVGMDGRPFDVSHSPFTDRFRTPIVYDFSNNQTYVGFVNRAGIGFDKQSRLLKILHDGKMVSPGGFANYTNSGVCDGHLAPGITITPDNEILLVHEEGSHTKNVFVEKTIKKSPGSLNTVLQFNDTVSYPQLTRIGSNIFLWMRYGNLVDDLFKSTDNGLTFSRTHVVTSGTRRPYSMTVYDSTKLRYMITALSDALGGIYTDNYYIESTDGVTFYNASHSFSKNVVLSGMITNAELNANCIASTTPGDTTYIKVCAVVTTPSGKIVSITNNGFTAFSVVYWNGTSWQTKPLNIPAGNYGDFMVMYPYSDSHFVFWRIENRNGYNVVVQYETTDFFDTIDAGTVISDPNTNHEQLNGTFNINDARKVVIAANALYPTENKLFIYEFTP